MPLLYLHLPSRGCGVVAYNSGAEERALKGPRGIYAHKTEETDMRGAPKTTTDLEADQRRARRISHPLARAHMREHVLSEHTTHTVFFIDQDRQTRRALITAR